MTTQITSDIRLEGRQLSCSLPLDCGQTLREVAVGYRLFGQLTGPLVIVQGGISANCHVCGTKDQPDSGWWNDFVGPGKAIDTDVYTVLSVDYLGGRDSTTGPDSLTAPEGLFPSVSTADQARLISRVIAGLNLGPVHAFVGASYGGMVGLAFGQLFAAETARLIIISAAHEAHPIATAWRSLQRKIVRLGRETGRIDDAMELARGLAMTTYRTADEFAHRFGREGIATPDGYRFPIDGYLEHLGRGFAKTFRASSFLCLSESIDLHRVNPAEITVPTTIIGVESDTLVPTWQSRQLANQISGPAELHLVDSVYGHDAFLKETESIGTIIRESMNSTTGEAQ